MYFSAAFIAAAAVYLCPVASAEGSSSAAIARPSFTPTSIDAPFFEQFTDDWSERWQASHAKKANTEEEWAFVGTWAVEEPTVFPGIAGDKALILKDKAAHHAISAKFPKAVNNKGKDLVVQYEVKLQDGLECGGAYMKLLQDNKALHQEEFSNASPYIIMFGPDRCGSTNKVHFIVRHKSPKTGEYEEKHMIDAPSIKSDKTSNLYTLVVSKDNTFQVRVNGDAVRNGTLLEDFQPAFNPPKEIDDPKDEKPSTWVDEPKIKDPEASKPADWDEDAPYEIEDADAEKPADWLDNEPQMIPDPEAQKPEDWDDEEDGDWEPPVVPNPKCADASGCGEWTRPMIRNPEYKGKWTAPMIDNPAYKGIWKPRKIANPNFFEDKTPSNLEPIGAIGFELWTMQGNIAFDNIYVGHSIADAEKLKKETFDVKKVIEDREEEEAKPKVDESAKSPFDVSFTKDPVNFVKQKVELFITLAQRDPIVAIKSVPEVSGTIGALIAAILLALIGGGGAAASKNPQVQAQAQKAKAKATEVKDQAADAVASGAQAAKEELNKRQTRSTSS